MKMRELVYQGHVTFRHKGKNIRIRTPPCKALRKLNQIEDWLEDIKLPPKVDICLRPINMEAFGRVQSVAQNPYVKTSAPLQKKVVSILKTFQSKWRTQQSKMVSFFYFDFIWLFEVFRKIFIDVPASVFSIHCF